MKGGVFMNKYADYIYDLLRTRSVESREEAISKTIDVFDITDKFELATLDWAIV